MERDIELDILLAAFADEYACLWQLYLNHNNLYLNRFIHESSMLSTRVSQKTNGYNKYGLTSLPEQIDKNNIHYEAALISDILSFLREAEELKEYIKTKATT